MGVHAGFARPRWAVVLLLLCICASSYAEDANPDPPTNDRSWSFHVQATAIPQGHGDFRALYSGANSLSPEAELKTSFTSTFYLGRKLWDGAEIYINPELLAGDGLSETLGIAGFPNGEIYRVDTPRPRFNLSRAFIRQSWGFGDTREYVEDGQNQVPQSLGASRFTLTVGKFSLVDLFDDNAYSHDARTQFMNWALMDNGAWDFAADTRGYTYGLATEMNRPRWAVRFAVVTVPKVANGMAMDGKIGKARSENLEYEHRQTLRGRPGAVRLMGYANHAHMGSYRATINTPEFHMDITRSRQYRLKYGFGVNLEQEIAKDVGVFFRYGWDDGHTETWAFTEIDRTYSGGLSFRGTRWGRKADRLGLAFVINGLSRDHADYLRAGGVGFVIGDGKLNYAHERIFETYYSLALGKGFFLSPDFQWVGNPAYNRDRGPVPIGALRLHWEL